jgi:hypothetical protein
MKNNMILNFFFLALFSTISSCDTHEYYKTFDYKNMTFVERTSKTDFCVRKISQTDNKIELEVNYKGTKIKRTYLKKEGYWYSKLKYETIEQPGFAVIYGDIYENEYFIYGDYLIYNDDTSFTMYVDLITEKMYVFDYIKMDDYSLFDLNNPQTGFKWVEDCYTMDDIFYIRNKHYPGQEDEGISIENHRSLANLDIYFWINLDLYNSLTDIKPIDD